MQDRYRGAELFPVLLQHVTGNVPGTSVETRGRHYGPLSPCLPIYPRHTNANKQAQWPLDTLSETHSPRHFSRDHFGKWRVPLFSCLEGKKPFKTMGEILSHYGNLPTTKRRCLPPRGQFIHWPLPSYYRLQVSLTNSRCAPHSSVQASHRPSIPELWVYLKFEVLKADLSGGFVSFTVLHVSEDRVWGRTRVGMRMGL